MRLTNHKKRTHRPDLMLVLTLFVGFGILVTSVAQAADPHSVHNVVQGSTNHQGSIVPVKSLWELGLNTRIQNWKPVNITPEDKSEGWNLSRPFGHRGPALKFSTTMPNELVRTLNAGGGDVNPASTKSNLFLFLEKRW